MPNHRNSSSAVALWFSLILLASLSLLAMTTCGKDSPTKPSPTQPPPPPPVQPVPTRITITPATATLTAVGQTRKLTASVLDQNAQPIAGANVSWSSSSTAVATVTSQGLVTAVMNGVARITARAGNVSTSIDVRVMQTAVSIVIEPEEATLMALGETVQLTAAVLDQNGQPVDGAAASWSSSDVQVAAVDVDGLVTSVGKGTAMITASNGGVTGTSSITVVQVVSTISITPASPTIMVGDTLRLTVNANDANGNMVVDAVFTWRSSDTTVLTVDESGLVTGEGVGEADISATSSMVTGTVQLRVRGFTLSGKVNDGRREGLVVPGAIVRVDSETNNSATTDADGQYRLSNLAGNVMVTVIADPIYLEQMVEVTIDSDRTLDFELVQTGVPPYQGTVWISPDILGPSDPTSFEAVTYTGRGMREVFDRRVKEWITVDAYLFEAKFGERTVEFQVNPEFGSREAALSQVNVFAPAIGRIPAVLMTNLREIELNAGEGLFGGNPYNGSFLIHTEDSSTLHAVSEGFLEELFLHEGAHVSLDLSHSDSPGWRAAQEADGVFISNYARNFPDGEDVAESFLSYFAVRYQPRRLTAKHWWLMTMTTPYRLHYFDEQEFDMSPYIPADPVVQIPETGTILPMPQNWQRFEESNVQWR